MIIESEEGMPIVVSFLDEHEDSRLYLEHEDSSRFKRNNRPCFVPKVYTRNAYGIRGHVEAYVAAFDKFWNLALEDCFEVWSRKVKRKAPAVGTIILLHIIYQRPLS